MSLPEEYSILIVYTRCEKCVHRLPDVHKRWRARSVVSYPPGGMHILKKDLLCSQKKVVVIPFTAAYLGILCFFVCSVVICSTRL